jgi:cell division protein FtsW (lipid II flippase)
MRRSNESDKQIIVGTVFSILTGISLLLVSIQNDGGTLAIMAVIGLFGMALVGVLQLIFRHLDRE